MKSFYEDFLKEEAKDFDKAYPDAVYREVPVLGFKDKEPLVEFPESNILPRRFDEPEDPIKPPIWTWQSGASEISVTQGRVVWNHDQLDFVEDATPVLESVARTGDHNNVDRILNGTGGTAVDGEAAYSGTTLYLIIITETDGKLDEAYYSTSTVTAQEYDAGLSNVGRYNYKLADIVAGTFTRYWEGGNWPFSGIEIDVASGGH